MIEYLSKTIFTTLPELIKPEHTAFIIVDIQKFNLPLILNAIDSKKDWWLRSKI